MAPLVSSTAKRNPAEADPDAEEAFGTTCPPRRIPPSQGH
jgi:hypothetical protein